MVRASHAGCAALLALAIALVAMLAAAGAASAKTSTVWLCKTGHAAGPVPGKTAPRRSCSYAGTTRQETVQNPVKHGRPQVDCFYVYPTVSEQEGPNANLEIEPQETQIAIDQASRFSQDCRVFAPMYRQLTLKAINNPGEVTPEAEVKAYLGVLDAFLEYMQPLQQGPRRSC